MTMIEYKVTMYLTSVDLREMAEQAEKIEREAKLGGSLVIRDWYCTPTVSVHLVVDQERARAKGLMQ